MLNDIVYALERCNKLVPINRVHLSNHAVNEVLPPEVKRLIGYSYEDTNIESFENGKVIGDIVSTLMPTQWIMIDTGDYITSENSDFDSETYDANYFVYLVHMEDYLKYQDRLIEVDSAWRKEMESKANKSDIK